MVHFFLFIQCTSRMVCWWLLVHSWALQKVYLSSVIWMGFVGEAWREGFESMMYVEDNFHSMISTGSLYLPSTYWMESVTFLQVCVNWRLFWAIWWGKTNLVSRMNIIEVEISSNVFFFFLFLISFFGWSFGWQQQK